MPTEATFILAGLLILIAVGGWAFGQFLDRDRDGQLPTRISADYIRGLNLVLSRKTDEALELFIQMAKVDDDTLETHFALGHLFRRRGEVDRAIRVHQNLLARPNLNEMQHDQAVFALAEDYLGAGLYDRAERLFSEIQDSETSGKLALERLVYIFEREREWKKAIETQELLENLGGEQSGQVAHYYCELAEEALAAGNPSEARSFLKAIARSETGALRGTLIRAGIARDEGNHLEALELLRSVLILDRSFISEILPKLADGYASLGQSNDFEAYIEELRLAEATTAGGLAYAAIANEMTGSPALDRCIEAFVAESEVLAELVNIDELRSMSPIDRQAALSRISSALRKLAHSSARYRCDNCGYSTVRFVWHCPSCKLWETIRPIQHFQLETTMH
jgi:lipopolysaccharide biosynthesis regulator YciM